jgi:hypothetical protein
MFQTICDQIPWDADASPRARRLELMRRVLDGTLYEALPYEFHDERSASGEYIPLRRRRPSVRYPLARIVVEDSVALLFSEGHFPEIASPDGAIRDALEAVARDCRLNQVMTEAAIRGSVGSCCLLLRVLQGRVFVDVLDTTWLTPAWQADAPDVLASVTERYKVPGRELQAAGYEVVEPGAAYWFQRRWDAVEETWFVPQAVGSAGAPAVDAGRSVRHGLGFVPLVWIRNLPGGAAPDGACTFRSAVETGIEIDYQLSQAGRGLKYSSDPTLLIKEPAGLEGELVRGAGNALIVSEKGDARLLEIGGTAAGAVLDYVRVLRDLALEGVHGNRADPSRLGAAQSGRALELMNQGLVWLADNLRVSYGEGGMLQMLRLILRAGEVYPLRAGGRLLGALDPAAALRLVWPPWYPATSEDRARDAATVLSLVQGGLLGRKAARRLLAADWNGTDLDEEEDA